MIPQGPVAGANGITATFNVLPVEGTVQFPEPITSTRTYPLPVHSTDPVNRASPKWDGIEYAVPLKMWLIRAFERYGCATLMTGQTPLLGLPKLLVRLHPN